ncbi:uncharacterized protein [Blastocystis hominis]|uniref:Uncharacterized protein n=1 Tax=Blastocystis hominis TaxID=12968 RepID=D8M733_BLAHO|nr:uncharacterized protein [Blastocystis hominis]CBK23872.2 unnamed protein product [Blastocystis hominis]|eukprot:XP_012897920.1 uncharacterized protein [Blastocystis hominis]
MGNTLSQTLYAFLQYFGLYSKHVTIAVIGLDNAGKTTMLYRIQNNKIIQMAPSLHVNEESFTFNGISFKALFEYYGNDFCVKLMQVFYFDYTHLSSFPCRRVRFKSSILQSKELCFLSEMPSVKNHPFGLLLNKCDRPDMISSEDVLSAVFQTSSLRPESIYTVLRWLASVV